MVRYVTVVRLAFEVAREQGIEFQNIADSSSFMADIGEYWSENKDRLTMMTKAQARSELRRVVEP